MTFIPIIDRQKSQRSPIISHTWHHEVRVVDLNLVNPGPISQEFVFSVCDDFAGVRVRLVSPSAILRFDLHLIVFISGASAIAVADRHVRRPE